jgi:hypothetical protein
MIILALHCDNNLDKQTKGLVGFEPPSRTIHSITMQRQYDHDYCAPAFSQVNLLLHYTQNPPLEELVGGRSPPLAVPRG